MCSFFLLPLRTRSAWTIWRRLWRWGPATWMLMTLTCWDCSMSTSFPVSCPTAMFLGVAVCAWSTSEYVSLVWLSVPNPPVSMFPWCSCLCLIHQWVFPWCGYACLIHQWVCFLGVAFSAWSISEYVSLVWLSQPDPPVSLFPWCLCLIHQWVCLLDTPVCFLGSLILHKTIPYFSLDSVLCRYSSEVPRRMEGDSMFCL